ncbi:MAG: type II toxin-antitoxin system RelE/ParE family toxin [Chromatiales bacterium]
MAEIVWTEEASRWLEDIFEYIALENPEAATRTVLGIYEQVQVLKTNPQIGYRYLASERHVRILLYGHYRVAYLLNDDGDVYILGVFHGALHTERTHTQNATQNGVRSCNATSRPRACGSPGEQAKRLKSVPCFPLRGRARVHFFVARQRNEPKKTRP